jgi:hypothetical protein
MRDETRRVSLTTKKNISGGRMSPETAAVEGVEIGEGGGRGVTV